MSQVHVLIDPFESLPTSGLLLDFHRTLDELVWWHDLDPRRLIMIMRSEAEH